MISNASLKPLIWCIRFGTWTHVFPFYWNTTQGRLVLFEDEIVKSRNYLIWRIFALFNVIVRCLLLSYLVGILLFGTNLSPSDILLVIFFICIFIMASPLHFLQYFYRDELYFNTNSLLALNERSGQIYSIM